MRVANELTEARVCTEVEVRCFEWLEEWEEMSQQHTQAVTRRRILRDVHVKIYSKKTRTND